MILCAYKITLGHIERHHKEVGSFPQFSFYRKVVEGNITVVSSQAGMVLQKQEAWAERVRFIIEFVVEF